MNGPSVFEIRLKCGREHITFLGSMGDKSFYLLFCSGIVFQFLKKTVYLGSELKILLLVVRCNDLVKESMGYLPAKLPAIIQASHILN